MTCNQSTSSSATPTAVSAAQSLLGFINLSNCAFLFACLLCVFITISHNTFVLKKSSVTITTHFPMTLSQNLKAPFSPLTLHHPMIFEEHTPDM